MAKIFADPDARSVYPLKRRAYSGMYYTLSGSYFYAGSVVQAVRCGLTSLALWPPRLKNFLHVPLRRWRARAAAVRGSPAN
jgi:hypothetical protein